MVRDWAMITIAFPSRRRNETYEAPAAPAIPLRAPRRDSETFQARRDRCQLGPFLFDPRLRRPSEGVTAIHASRSALGIRRLRSLWPQGRAGSSPLFRPNPLNHVSTEFPRNSVVAAALPLPWPSEPVCASSVRGG